MTLFGLGLAVVLAGGVLALLLGRRYGLSAAFACGGAVLGSALGLAPAAQVLLQGRPLGTTVAWSPPFGQLSFAIDRLSAFFLVPIFGLSAVAALYGVDYLKAYRGRPATPAAFFFFNLLTVAMAAVVTARNGLAFLLAWEVMSLASFLLVTFEDEKRQVRRAGWIYLAATHVGTAFLLPLLLLVDLQRPGVLGGPAWVLFLLALVGFGTKAGLMPLHVWLPHAHPAAPSHVSALMSGVMIKMGVYGLLRMLMLLGPPPAWWGILLVSLGAVSAVGGIVYALAQEDLKRLLAYSSVENVGVITIGVGIGVVGMSAGNRVVAALGFAGALLHVLNHAIFKSLLFCGAGGVLRAAGTLNLERLGGLLRRLPVTGAGFLTGTLAATALPPLNGFVSEWLIYAAAFRGGVELPPLERSVALTAIPVLALTGGLAAVCFGRTFGIAFLGEPRRPLPRFGAELGPWANSSVTLLAASCLLVGLAPAVIVGLVLPVAGDLASGSGQIVAIPGSRTLVSLSQAFGVLLAVVLGLGALRRALLAGRLQATGATWGCGYARPTPRMQYTAASFAQPLLDLFRPLLVWRTEAADAAGSFPRSASFRLRTDDLVETRLLGPTFRAVSFALARIRVLQRGRVQLYLLYIFFTLLVLLAWQLWR
jgi:formate hydrogenlyase subunit 3/multisubunit Na+/H+ antiporter MnhD subunit